MTPPLKAALWMSGAIFSFTAMAIAAREIGHIHDSFEIMAARSIIGLVLVLVIGRAVVRRFGVRRRRRDLPDRHRRRRWWIDPDPGRLHRAHRAEGHLRTHSPRSPTEARQHDDVDGVHGPLRARHRPLVRRDQRP